MASYIEDYALLSDMNTAALVSRAGSIDWFCAPRFDSGAVFAALLGERDNGRWLLAPLESMNPTPVEEIRIERSYRENTFVLQTVWSVGDASVRVTDFMPLAAGTSIVRNVEGLTGEVTMYNEIAMRFDNGKTQPWVTRYDGAPDANGNTNPEESMLVGMAGPHALVFRGDAMPDGEPDQHAGTFTVTAGQNYVFTLSYFASNQNPPAPIDYPTALNYAQEQWREWSGLYVDEVPETPEAPAEVPAVEENTHYGDGEDVDTNRIAQVEAPATDVSVDSNSIAVTREVETEVLEPSTNTTSFEIDAATYEEFAQTSVNPIVEQEEDDAAFEAELREARLRSLLVLRAMISRETGGLVASVTTSLPEVLGGKRNWDHRFAWLRDVAMAMDVTLAHGHERETAQLRNWMLRALANNPYNLHAVYGVAGEKDDLDRRLALAGYEGAQPVRSGNGSHSYFQGDALGQVLATFANLRRHGVGEDHLSWPLQQALLNSAVEKIGSEDRSIWEMAGEPHIFTHSQAMLWAAFDAGVTAVTEHGMTGDAQAWAEARDRVAEEILERGYNEELNSFVQTYDGVHVDASLLQLAQIGFVAWDDPRMVGTVERIEDELMHESGLIYRYINRDSIDGFEGQDNPHFGASLWLAEQYLRSGRAEDGKRVLRTVLALSNDLGLLSASYDFEAQRMTGNFPHIIPHIALIRAVEAV